MIEARGRHLAALLTAEQQPRATRFRALTGRAATLAMLAADDPASRRFIGIKQEQFGDAGLAVRPVLFSAASDTSDVVRQLAGLNRDGEVAAIFLQFPLPPGVAAQDAADAIAAEKDVDALGSSSLGKVLAGKAGYLPATVAAVLRLLEDELGSLQGRSIVFAGEPGVTERCLALLTLVRGGTACIIAPSDPALADAAAGAEAVVITGELPPGGALRHVRNGALLMDAGYALPPRPAGWLPARALEHLGTYLPQYRNVGPLTVALLIQATLDAAFLGIG